MMGLCIRNDLPWLPLLLLILGIRVPYATSGVDDQTGHIKSMHLYPTQQDKTKGLE